VDVCTTDIACDADKKSISPAVQFVEFDITNKYHVCTTGPDAGPAALTFDGGHFAQICELNDEVFLQDQFSKFDMGMLQAVDKAMVALLKTQIDASHGGASFKYPFFITQASGVRTLNPEWLLFVSETLANDGINSSDVVIFGGRMVKAIAAAQKIATASTEGYDISKSFGDIPDLYYDKNFDSVFGVNQIVTIPKGLFQLVTFNQYVGSKAFRGETKILFTKTAPLGNGATLTFDYVWERDPECDKYSYFPSLWAELVKGIVGGCANDKADGLYIFEDCADGGFAQCPPAP
jgi:hypothetical protein